MKVIGVSSVNDTGSEAFAGEQAERTNKIKIKTMTNLQWTDEYSVKNAEIDEQHKEFIRICNEILSLKDKESFPKEEGIKKVLQLGDYAFYHLDAEEKLFNESEYPKKEVHIKAHNQFREKTKSLIEQVRSENSDIQNVILDAAQFAGTWLLDHIGSMDKQYVKYL